jgi:hypothetical protein
LLFIVFFFILVHASIVLANREDSREDKYQSKPLPILQKRTNSNNKPGLRAAAARLE